MLYNLHRGVVWMFFYLLGFMQPAKMKRNAVFDVQDTAGHLFPLKLLMPIEETILEDTEQSLHTSTTYSIPPRREQ